MKPDKKEELLELAVEPWTCLSVKPPECYWSDCGCDPYATKVLHDTGWEPPSVSRPYGGTND